MRTVWRLFYFQFRLDYFLVCSTDFLCAEIVSAVRICARAQLRGNSLAIEKKEDKRRATNLNAISSSSPPQPLKRLDQPFNVCICRLVNADIPPIVTPGPCLYRYLLILVAIWRTCAGCGEHVYMHLPKNFCSF